MFPGGHQHFRAVDDAGYEAGHALPNTRQITQVENVVELGWGGQHLRL